MGRDSFLYLTAFSAEICFIVAHQKGFYNHDILVYNNMRKFEKFFPALCPNVPGCFVTEVKGGVVCADLLAGHRCAGGARQV